MALVRADQRMILIEGIPLLFIRPDDLLQHIHIKLMSAGSIDSINQLLHICPAVFIQCDVDGIRLVAEDQGNKLACFLQFPQGGCMHPLLSFYRFGNLAHRFNPLPVSARTDK